MLTYNEIINLKSLLLNDEITLESAKSIFWADFKEGKRAWHTKDWKERRAKIIKESCEICGSTETLTLQHLSHPKKYFDYEKEITNKYTKLYIDSTLIIEKRDFTKHVIENYEYVPIPLCPNCKSRYPNQRMRKKPKYLCTACRNEFAEPVYKQVNELIDLFYENKEIIEVHDKCFISKDKWKNQHNLLQAMYWLQRKQAKIENAVEIGKEAFILFLEDNIKYLSFEDTITACKKCAYRFDIKNMELCPKCKTYYKGIQYPTCIQCLPDEKREAALKKIDYGRKMKEMHKNLGID